MSDLYQTLGVKREASAQQIKDAYRDKAKATHPDAGGDGGEFAAVSTAYEVLSDGYKRAKYDKTGDASDTSQGRPFSIAVEIYIAVAVADPPNIWKAISQVVGEKRAAMVQQQDKCDDAIKGVRKMLKRITGKPENDFIGYELLSRIKAMELGIAHAEAEVLELDKAEALLKGYVFEQREERAAPMFEGFVSFDGQAFNSAQEAARERGGI